MEIATSIAIITALTQAIKMGLKVPSRFVPLLSIGLGIGFVALGDVPLQETIITGIIIGLSSSGLYQVGKKTVLNK
jgi:hydrogenase/urease accessory protein HupE